MGAKQSLNQSTQLSSINSSIDNQNLDPFEKQQCNCLGLPTKRQNKSNLKSKVGPLTWEANAIKFCEGLKGKPQWTWASQVVQVIKNKSKKREKFISDFNHLKYMDKMPSHSQKQLSLTPSQIINFKANLRKSVLLSLKDISNKRPSKIQQQEHIRISTNLKKSQRELDFLKEVTNINNDKCLIVMGDRQSYNKNKIKVSQSYLRQSVINLVDDTMSSLFKGQQKQISKLSANALDMFVKFTVMLQKHLNDPQHKIYEVIHCFTENLYKNFKVKTQSSSHNRPRKLSGLSQINAIQLQILIKDIKKFIALLNQMIYDYYNLATISTEADQSNNFLINNIENIRTINTAILFKNQKFYSFIFNNIRQFNRQNEQSIEEKFQILHGKPPQYFEIRRQYCLNNNSFKKFVQQMSSVESNIQNFSPQQLESQSEQPYTKCAEALAKITKARTPIAKMKTILECAQLITLTISQFYESNQMKLKNQLLDADTVLSIFRYVLSLHKIQNLFSHIFLIDMFATEQQKMSMTGYYFTVLNCAILKNFGEDEDQMEERQIHLIIDETKSKVPNEQQQTQKINGMRKFSKQNVVIELQASNQVNIVETK